MTANSSDFFLDITQDKCPMTFVRAKLLAEKMSSAQVALLRLTAGEPLENLPRSLEEHGYQVISVTPESETAPEGAWLLAFRAP